MARKNKTVTLEGLRQAVVREKQRARDSESAARTASLEADQAREQLIESHANGDARAVKVAEKLRAKAMADAEDASIQAEAAKRRADRAERERQAFEAEHGRELIAELEPAAVEVANRLQQAAGELVSADADWSVLRERVSGLLRAIPDASPAEDGVDSSHALAEVARVLRRGGAYEVPLPLPHWRGTQHRAAEQQRVEAAREARA